MWSWYYDVMLLWCDIVCNYFSLRGLKLMTSKSSYWLELYVPVVSPFQSSKQNERNLPDTEEVLKRIRFKRTYWRIGCASPFLLNGPAAVPRHRTVCVGHLQPLSASSAVRCLRAKAWAGAVFKKVLKVRSGGRSRLSGSKVETADYWSNLYNY